MSVNIAIDGPAGAGKSTIAKAAAKAVGFIYVDTGALYRSIAYYAISKGTNVSDPQAVASLLPRITPELKFIDGSQHVFVNGEDVSDKIRTPEISMGASAVSAIPAVRDFLFDLQKKIASENNVIMDGRDIGTVVLPDADLKIFLTASAEERARRRHAELTEKGECVDFDSVLADVNQRDYNDSHREIAPLKQAEDAVLCDTTELDLGQATEKVIALINETTKTKGLDDK
ncbi:MAG: (d)CMP kinase [Oscillospiraceae bacterium]|nr:(d)CMP kinase [Oscillospiraceae bacterium]